ncbi:hypothetical protein ARMGADRAFT_382575 [Armillaria gallica]|uniref:RRM domain-containing protein n=1 Tax=Armillaria gallica TaxID=47427 RepID=A0A2H3EHI7_ARMGA|nr:hypothetical protein ARMGADRAFT_382575 [Armillaria gallica]
MPAKSSTASRAWGTRFDSLPPTSPPLSPSSFEHSLRDVGTANSGQAPFDASNKQKEEKMPHDASVFVGSLPGNIDQPELARLLSLHLSEHAQVKNVKVVRDSKGGVCAFVQCEDAAAAASLIHTLHSTEPKPFLGRHLRYEPARAFRTLLLSYRIPMQFIPITDGDAVPGEHNRGKHVELDLPYAMRLWRPRNSKYLALLYNAEAVEAENQASASKSRFSGDSCGDQVLHLQPVTCDAETIERICFHFGPLEQFQPYKAEDATDSEDDSLRKPFPYPHDGPRSPSMDTRCFEVKWAHRDDCVSALMTLRRVPHLTVTWAHQPTFNGRQSPYQNRSPSSNAALYPMYLHDQGHMRGGPLAASLSSGSRRDSATTEEYTCVTRSVGEWNGLPQNARNGESTFAFMDSTLVDTSMPNLGSSQGEWNEMDFPPLVDVKERKTDFSGVWGEKKAEDEREDKGDTREIDGLASTMGAVSLPDTPHVTYDMSEEPFAAEKEENSAGYQDVEQELDMPPTPGLGMSPITPRTPGVMFPATPTSTIGDLHGIVSFNGYDSKDKDGYPEENTREERLLDPTTLFVGGLEMYGPGAWDEEKVSNFFRKFGGLESVKVVRPVNGRAAFAFVKFDNTESPARAVFEEHNRVYEGRAMRVQLRDCNPPRSSWKYGRGRGRFPHHNIMPHRYYGETNEMHHHREHSRRTDMVAHGETSGMPTVDTDAPPPFDVGTHLDDTTSKRNSEVPSNTETVSTSAHDQEAAKILGTTEAPPPTENYREWYDALEPSPTETSSPVTLNPTVPFPGAGGAGVQFPMPAGTYYPPPPWVQPYTPQMQYPVPYFAGPAIQAGYAVPQPSAPGYSSATGSDANGPVSAPQNLWAMGMYGAYIPYPAFPSRPTHHADSSVPQQAQVQQPPVIPTGFIQNDQGTLIAVYQPEAIDQYMTGGQVSTPPNSGQAPATMNNWTSPAPTFGVPGQLPPRMSMQARQMLAPPGGMGWIPANQSTIAFPASGSHQAMNPSGSMPLPSATAFRASHDLSANHLNPSLRRNNGRRDQQFNPNRNSNRPLSNRHSRPNGNNVGPGFNEGQPQRTMPFPVQF